MLPPALIVAFLIASGVMILFVVAPAFIHRHQTRWVHAWGRCILFLFGVKVEVHGVERRAAPGAALLLFNHVSLLDLMVLATQWDQDSTVIYKKEFHRIPVIGFVMKRLGMIAIDRSDHEQAVASLEAAAALVRARQCKVFLAPEGTRSRRGGLQEFKLGGFHLAVATRAPVLPTLMRGIEGLNPAGSWLIRSGTVRLDYLDPIATTDWTDDTVREHAASVRELFLRYLPAAPAA
jgi:1-acyl-sn-glycerol-3-phosphate acyltransferase